jgi:hypothetical protein
MISQNQEEEKTRGFFNFLFLKKIPYLIRVPQNNHGVTPCNLSDFAVT